MRVFLKPIQRPKATSDCNWDRLSSRTQTRLILETKSSITVSLRDRNRPVSNSGLKISVLIFRPHLGLHNPRARPSLLLAQPFRDNTTRFRRQQVTFQRQGWCFSARRSLYILHVPIILTHGLFLHVHCKSIRVESSRLSDSLVFPASCVSATCWGKYCSWVLSIPIASLGLVS